MLKGVLPPDVSSLVPTTINHHALQYTAIGSAFFIILVTLPHYPQRPPVQPLLINHNNVLRAGVLGTTSAHSALIVAVVDTVLEGIDDWAALHRLLALT